ncbi:MAG: hypothetical protein K2Z81_16190, partial [Cyanobacteria bacterium]|nr:hypothetical protein [Cyanobacteriota bacterium]
HEGTRHADGTIRFQRDNGDTVIRRPDRTTKIVDSMGNSRIMSPEGRVIITDDRTMGGGTTAYSYNRDGSLNSIKLGDDSMVTREGETWVRTYKNGRQEAYWNGEIKVEPDGSPRYTHNDNPKVSMVRRADGVLEHHDASGRIKYSEANLRLEREQLHTLADSIKEPWRQRRFKDMMSQFEEQATRGGMTDEQIGLVFHQFRRMLAPGNEAVMSKANREIVAEQALYQILNRDLVSQGANPTCNVTTVEKRILLKHPDAYVQLLADVANTGKYVTKDGSVVDMTRIPGTLEPDAEARMLKPSMFSGKYGDLHIDGRISFASQIFEQAAVNIKYRDSEKYLGDEYIGPDDIVMYQKDVHLPGQQGGRLVKYSTDYEGKLVAKQLDTSPSIGGGELVDINNQIVGTEESGFVIRGNRSFGAWEAGKDRVYTEADFAPGSLRVASSPAQLSQILRQLNQTSNLPAIIQVHTGHKFFGNDGTLNQGGLHVISIDRITTDRQGKPVLHFTNQWSAKHNGTMTTEELYTMMNPPPRVRSPY